MLRLSKRLRIGGPFEHAMIWIAGRLIPAPGSQVEITLPLGASLKVPANFSRVRSYAAGIYEQDVTQTFLSVIKEGMTVVDVGAFCGYYTVLASRLVGESGHVYAFEPFPASYAQLLENIEANGCANVTAAPWAVSDRVGTETMVIKGEIDHYWLNRHNSGVEPSIEVPAITLDSFFEELGWPRVDVIKMDIEGSETAAFAGMRALSERNPDLQLIVEFDVTNIRRAGFKPENYTRLLTELGFKEGYIIEQGLRPFSVRESPPRGRATYDLLLKKDNQRGDRSA